MTPTGHIISSGVASACFYFYSRSLAASAACFLSGILIDLDHMIDFYISKKRLCLRYEEMSAFCYKEKAGRHFLVLHSYELMALLWLAVYFFRPPLVWPAVIFGMTVHILLDKMTNPLRPWVYSFTYRWRKGFDKKNLYYEERYKQLE